MTVQTIKFKFGDSNMHRLPPDTTAVTMMPTSVKIQKLIQQTTQHLMQDIQEACLGILCFLTSPLLTLGDCREDVSSNSGDWKCHKGFDLNQRSIRTVPIRHWQNSIKSNVRCYDRPPLGTEALLGTNSVVKTRPPPLGTEDFGKAFVFLILHFFHLTGPLDLDQLRAKDTTTTKGKCSRWNPKYKCETIQAPNSFVKFMNHAICGTKTTTNVNVNEPPKIQEFEFSELYFLRILPVLLLWQYQVIIANELLKYKKFENKVFSCATVQALLSLATADKCEYIKVEGDDKNSFTKVNTEEEEIVVSQTVLEASMEVQGGGNPQLFGFGYDGDMEDGNEQAPFMNNGRNGDEEILNQVPDFRNFDDEEEDEDDADDDLFGRRPQPFDEDADPRRVPGGAFPPVDDFMEEDDYDGYNHGRGGLGDDGEYPNAPLVNHNDVAAILRQLAEEPILHDPEPPIPIGIQNFPLWMENPWALEQVLRQDAANAA